LSVPGLSREMMQLMRGRRTRARLLLKKRYARIYRIRRFANRRIDSIEDLVAFQAVRLAVDPRIKLANIARSRESCAATRIHANSALARTGKANGIRSSLSLPGPTTAVSLDLR